MGYLDGTGLSRLISKIKAAFWSKTDVVQISIDNTPTESSDNLVKSGGVYAALEDKQDEINSSNKLPYSLISDTPTIPDEVEANPTVPSGTTPTTLSNLKVGNDYYSVPQGGGGTVDQTYDPTSQNAQSGVAMAGALAGKQSYYNCQLADIQNPREGDVCVTPFAGVELEFEPDPEYPSEGVVFSGQDTYTALVVKKKSTYTPPVEDAVYIYTAASEADYNNENYTETVFYLSETTFPQIISGDFAYLRMYYYGYGTVSPIDGLEFYGIPVGSPVSIEPQTYQYVNGVWSLVPESVEANPTVPQGTTPTDLTGLKVGSSYYKIDIPVVPDENTLQKYYTGSPNQVTNPKEGDVCVAKIRVFVDKQSYKEYFDGPLLTTLIIEKVSGYTPSSGEATSLVIRSGESYEAYQYYPTIKNIDLVNDTFPYTYSSNTFDTTGISWTGDSPMNGIRIYGIPYGTNGGTYLYLNGAWIEYPSGGGTVDSALSTTSENPVQNKVITGALNGKQSYYNCPLAQVSNPKEGDVCVVPATETEVTADSNGNFAINGVGVKIEENASNPIPSDGNTHSIYIGKGGVGYDDLLLKVLGRGSDGTSTDLPYTFVDYGGIAAVGTNPSGMGQHQSAYYIVKKVVPSQTYVYVNGAWRSDNNDSRQKAYELEFLEGYNMAGYPPYWLKAPVTPTTGDIGYWEEFSALLMPNNTPYSTWESLANGSGVQRAIKVTLNQSIPSGNYSTVYISPYSSSHTTGYTITAVAGFVGKVINITYTYGGTTTNEVAEFSAVGSSKYLRKFSAFDGYGTFFIIDDDNSGQLTSLLDYITIEFVNEAGVKQFDGTNWGALPENSGNKVMGGLNQYVTYTDDQYPSVPTMQAELAKKASAPEIATFISTSAYLSPYSLVSSGGFINGAELRYTQPLTSIDASSVTVSALSLSASSEYTAWLVFTSGSTATSFTYPSEWKWSGDDVDNGSFVPAVNKTYNICVWWDGVNLNAIARGTAYVASS